MSQDESSGSDVAFTTPLVGAHDYPIDQAGGCPNCISLYETINNLWVSCVQSLPILNQERETSASFRHKQL